MRSSRFAIAATLTISLAACVVRVMKRDIREVGAAQQSVRSPLRVFLADGSVVVFDRGAMVSTSGVTSDRPAQRFDLARLPAGTTRNVPMDSVIGMEAFDARTDPGLSLLASVGLTALTVGGTVALACAADPKCFGSCPTVYTYDGSGERLEAEAFSYSISPLLEGRDVDRLTVQPDEDGVVEIEVRNEALETHFINHLELLEVRHASGQRVLPDHRNRPLTIGALSPVERVTDRDGRDVSEALAAPDGQAFSTSDARVAAVSARDDRDWITFTLPPVWGDSVALALRLRNSLLSTVLFYEFMLGRQGAGALDWMAQEVEQIGNAVELGSWFQKTMGLRLEVLRAGHFEEVARMGDSGPIAWKEVAFLVPIRAGEPTRVRLSFLADEWRIDHAAWSPHASRSSVRAIPPSAVVPILGGPTPDPLGQVAEPDDRYLVTSAGTAFTLRFRADAVPGGVRRTFLLSSQGYYTEWVRPDWVRSAGHPEPFRPTAELVPELMERWRSVKGPMESAFHETKIPVR